MTKSVVLFLLYVLIEMSLGGEVSCARSASWDLWFSVREALGGARFLSPRKRLRVSAAAPSSRSCRTINTRIISENAAEGQRHAVSGE